MSADRLSMSVLKELWGTPADFARVLDFNVDAVKSVCNSWRTECANSYIRERSFLQKADHFRAMQKRSGVDMTRDINWWVYRAEGCRRKRHEIRSNFWYYLAALKIAREKSTIVA